MSKSTAKFRPGDRIVTNDDYARIIGNKSPHEGVIVKPVEWCQGLWSVMMPVFVKPQDVHESMMEKKITTTNSKGV